MQRGAAHSLTPLFRVDSSRRNVAASNRHMGEGLAALTVHMISAVSAQLASPPSKGDYLRPEAESRGS